MRSGNTEPIHTRQQSAKMELTLQFATFPTTFYLPINEAGQAAIYHKLVNSFNKRPYSKYFRPGGPYSLCHKYTTLSSYHESSHRQYINKHILLHSKTEKQTDLLKQGAG